MRIIRTIMILRLLLAIIMPYEALAAGSRDTNETNINFKIENKLTLNNGVIKDKYRAMALSPFNLEKDSKVKTAREMEVERSLAKYAEKRQKAQLPKGKFLINASAYTAAADECGKSDGITASGLKVRENETIACPPSYPFGTRITIEGMGTYICEDRGGAIKGNKIDIYVETKREAFAFGRQHLLAEVVM
jgi:3D (Asp-Asp-Asp) domain-containing protein